MWEPWEGNAHYWIFRLSITALYSSSQFQLDAWDLLRFVLPIRFEGNPSWSDEAVKAYTYNSGNHCSGRALVFELEQNRNRAAINYVREQTVRSYDDLSWERTRCGIVSPLSRESYKIVCWDERPENKTVFQIILYFFVLILLSEIRIRL